MHQLKTADGYAAPQDVRPMSFAIIQDVRPMDKRPIHIGGGSSD